MHIHTESWPQNLAAPEHLEQCFPQTVSQYNVRVHFLASQMVIILLRERVGCLHAISTHWEFSHNVELQNRRKRFPSVSHKTLLAPLQICPSFSQNFWIVMIEFPLKYFWVIYFLACAKPDTKFMLWSFSKIRMWIAFK